MNEEKLKKELENQGFKKVYIGEDKPNEFYKKHNHPYGTKLIILNGSMRIILENKILKLKSKDNIYIKAYETHEVLIGKNGCKYLVGEEK